MTRPIIHQPLRPALRYSMWSGVILVCCVLWTVVTSQARVSATQTSTVKVLGNFSNVKHAHGDAFGYSLKLWQEEDQMFGLLLVYTGAPSDPPTGILEKLKLEPRNRRLSFSARLSTGIVYAKDHDGVPSRDRFTFTGVLTRNQVSGTLTRSDELFPNERATSVRIKLRRSELLTDVMLPPPPTYSAWKTWADEILERRGPKW